MTFLWAVRPSLKEHTMCIAQSCFIFFWKIFCLKMALFAFSSCHMAFSFILNVCLYSCIYTFFKFNVMNIIATIWNDHLKEMIMKFELYVLKQVATYYEIVCFVCFLQKTLFVQTIHYTWPVFLFLQALEWFWHIVRLENERMSMLQQNLWWFICSLFL